MYSGHNSVFIETNIHIRQSACHECIGQLSLWKFQIQLWKFPVSYGVGMKRSRLSKTFYLNRNPNMFNCFLFCAENIRWNLKQLGVGFAIEDVDDSRNNVVGPSSGCL